MILHYFAKKENDQNDHPKDIYLSIVKFIEKIYSKKKYNLNKNFNTSFEITVILLFIVFSSFKNKKNSVFTQKLMDYFISDIDITLRTLGIGDMNIGKYVKKYVKKTYYRFKLLEKIIESKDYEEFEKYILKFDLFFKNNKYENNNYFIKYFFDYIFFAINRSKTMNFSDFVFI